MFYWNGETAFFIHVSVDSEWMRVVFISKKPKTEALRAPRSHINWTTSYSCIWLMNLQWERQGKSLNIISAVLVLHA